MQKSNILGRAYKQKVRRPLLQQLPEMKANVANKEQVSWPCLLAVGGGGLALREGRAGWASSELVCTWPDRWEQVGTSTAISGGKGTKGFVAPFR